MGNCLSSAVLARLLSGSASPRNPYALHLGVPIAPPTRLLADVSAGALVSFVSCDRIWAGITFLLHRKQSAYTTATAIEALLDCADVSGSTDFLLPYIDSMFGQRVPREDAQLDVETQLAFASAWLRVFDFNEDIIYANRARSIVDSLIARNVWTTDTCNGGAVSTLHPHPPASSQNGAKLMSTTLALGAALVSLEHAFPAEKDPRGREYADWAREVWEWMDGMPGLVDPSGLVQFGVEPLPDTSEPEGRSRCVPVAACCGERVWAHVQGLYIRFAAGYSRLARDMGARQQGLRVLQATIRHFAAEDAAATAANGSPGPSIVVFREDACERAWQSRAEPESCARRCTLNQGQLARDAARALETLASGDPSVWALVHSWLANNSASVCIHADAVVTRQGVESGQEPDAVQADSPELVLAREPPQLRFHATLSPLGQPPAPGDTVAELQGRADASALSLLAAVGLAGPASLEAVRPAIAFALHHDTVTSFR